MRAGTYPARDYATLERSELPLTFTGAYTESSCDDKSSLSPSVVDLPILVRFQPLYFLYGSLQGPVF